MLSEDICSVAMLSCCFARRHLSDNSAWAAAQGFLTSIGLLQSEYTLRATGARQLRWKDVKERTFSIDELGAELASSENDGFILHALDQGRLLYGLSYFPGSPESEFRTMRFTGDVIGKDLIRNYAGTVLDRVSMMAPLAYGCTTNLGYHAWQNQTNIKYYRLRYVTQQASRNSLLDLPPWTS